MHPILENFFEACKNRVLSRVDMADSYQLSSRSLIESLKKETEIDIPYLGIDKLADPEIGFEYFQEPDTPEGIDLPEGVGNVYFVLYKVPIKGPSNIVQHLIGNSAKPDHYWIDDDYLYYKRYNQDLMTSPEARNEIKEKFKETMLSLNNQLHVLMQGQKEIRTKIDSFILTSITEEANRRNQELSIRNSLNPFS